MQNSFQSPKPLNLTWRPTGQDDLPAIVELSQSCYASDGGLGFLFTPEMIQSRFLPGEPCFTTGAFRPDGRLAACASVSIVGAPGNRRARFVGQVHPELRRRGIGTYLMAWIQAQTAALLAALPEAERVMQIATESLTGPAHRLYVAHGFTCVFDEYVMERALFQPLPDRPLPQDVTLTSWQPNLAEQFFQAYHNAFRDRPGFPGHSAAQWISGVLEDDHRPEWSLLARVNGEPAGFVTGFMDLTTDPAGGYIGQVGVVPAHRRRGLASLLLLESMRRMQADGAKSALLTVHLNNPGAIAAYEQLGFTKVGRRARYESGREFIEK